jgi:hypothetical protein
MDEKTLIKDITCEHVAKLMVPYLKVTEAKWPTLAKEKLQAKFWLSAMFEQGLKSLHAFYLFCVNSRDECKEIRKHMKWEKEGETRMLSDRENEEKKLEQYLIKEGITKDAWIVANFTGLCLKSIIFHAEAYPDFHLEITKRTPYGPEEIKVTKETFADLVDLAIKDGIYVLEDHYCGVPLVKGMPRQFKIVNPDFKDSAKEKLLEEVYSEIKGGDKVNLLEAIAIKMDNEGKIFLEILYKKLGE